MAYAVPGVPHEMVEMLERAILPDLRERSGVTSVIRSRVVRTWGDAESAIAERLGEHMAELDAAGPGAPTIAFQASGIEGIKVRITVKDEPDAADARLAEEEAAVRAVLGDIVFGVDEESMEHAVGELLKERGFCLGLAESVTGGLVGSRLTEVPGSSDWFRGSIVSYDSEVKFDLLDVPRGPVVNEATAEAMARGAPASARGRRGPGRHRRGRAGRAGRPARGDGVLRGGHPGRRDLLHGPLPRLAGAGAAVRRHLAARRPAPAAARLAPPSDLSAAPAPPKPRRLFVAAWPPAEVVEALAALHRPEEPAVRWTRPEAWHVTLRFLGGVAAAAVPSLVDALRALRSVPAVTAELGPVTRRLGRSVLVVPVAGLDGVAAAVDGALAGAGVPPPERPFTGHLTVARPGAGPPCPGATPGCRWPAAGWWTR